MPQIWFLKSGLVNQVINFGHVWRKLINFIPNIQTLDDSMERRRREVDEYCVDIERLRNDADVTKLASAVLKRVGDLKTTMTAAQTILKSKIRSDAI